VKEITTRLAWDMDAVGGEHLSVVLFYSRISEPSLLMIDVLAELAPTYSTVKFFTVDTDKNPEIIWRFRVSIVPTIMMFRNEQKLQEVITAKTADELRSAIQTFLPCM
jgi:thioredoxin 1